MVSAAPSMASDSEPSTSNLMKLTFSSDNESTVTTSIVRVFLSATLLAGRALVPRPLESDTSSVPTLLPTRALMHVISALSYSAHVISFLNEYRSSSTATSLKRHGNLLRYLVRVSP